jgi:hypothetical protein
MPSFGGDGSPVRVLFAERVVASRAPEGAAVLLAAMASQSREEQQPAR